MFAHKEKQNLGMLQEKIKTSVSWFMTVIMNLFIQTFRVKRSLSILRLPYNHAHMPVSHTQIKARARTSTKRMKYSNLEADSVYGYLIWVIRFEYLKKKRQKK